MIKFEGEVSKNVEKFMFRKYTHAMLLAATVAVVLLGIPITIFAITVDLKFLLFLLIFLVPYVLAFLPIDQEKPTKAFVDLEEETVVVEGNKFEKFRMISDVSKVEDWGEFYYIVFPSPKKDTSFIFQKDLITQGTIEEFESIFEGKIVRIKK